MLWTVILCTALGALLGLAVSSGDFLEGWRGDSAADDDAETALDGADEPQQLVLGRWSPSSALSALGGALGLVAGVASALIVPLTWLAMIAGAAVTAIVVLLVAPLCIGEVRHGLVEEGQGDPAEEEEGDQ